MVRRLVEQEQVRRAEEQPAERHATPLAAREGRHVAVAVREPEGVHRAIERRVERPRAAAVDLLLDAALLGEQRVDIGSGLGEGRGDGSETIE